MTERQHAIVLMVILTCGLLVVAYVGYLVFFFDLLPTPPRVLITKRPAPFDHRISAEVWDAPGPATVSNYASVVVTAPGDNDKAQAQCVVVKARGWMVDVEWKGRTLVIALPEMREVYRKKDDVTVVGDSGTPTRVELLYKRVTN